MPLLVAINGWRPEPWLECFRRLGAARGLPGDEIVDARQRFDPEAVTYAAVWQPAAGLLARLPNLRAIFNLGAGVDALLADRTLPDVPLFRIIDEDLTRRMTEWITLQVLYHARQMPAYRRQQAARLWRPLDQAAAKDIRIGIMGMGVLGKDAAGMLARLGFALAGWSRSGHGLAGIEEFSGRDALPAFLARTDILVVLLPLTQDTHAILDRNLFAQLARGGPLGGPVLINAGRGGLQVEDDVVQALGDGTLIGASLDVFAAEPLAPSSPLWTHPGVVITPHVAADSAPEALVSGIFRTIAAVERGENPPNRVDRRTGY